MAGLRWRLRLMASSKENAPRERPSPRTGGNGRGDGSRRTAGAACVGAPLPGRRRDPASLGGRCRSSARPSNGNASRSCWTTQAAVGHLVTARCTTRRRAWWTKTRTYRMSKVAVGTVKKSIPTMASWWLRRKTFHRSTTSPGAGLLGMYRDTVLSAMSKPSISSSPWIRGAPQVGFSRAIWRMRSRSSLSMRGLPWRPGRDRHRQNRRKPSRCQRTTVSGCTTTRTSAHRDQSRRRKTQKSRSVVDSRGRGLRSARTATC